MADWISATTLMLRSSFSARRRFLRTGIEQRQPALHVGVDVRLAVLDLARRRPAGRRSSSPARSPRRPDRSGCRSWPTGRPIGSRRRGHLGRLDEPHPRACRRRRRTAAGSTRRRGPCGGRSPAAACASGSGGRTRRAPPAPRRPAARRRARCRGDGPIGVPAADDVADAVFVAVDGELVGDGQRAALVADLRPVAVRRRRACRPCRPPAGPPPSRFHARAVDVVDRLGRIDEIVPQFVERLASAGVPDILAADRSGPRRAIVRWFFRSFSRECILRFPLG